MEYIPLWRNLSGEKYSFGDESSEEKGVRREGVREGRIGLWRL
jgi:hypothetical protein